MQALWLEERRLNKEQRLLKEAVQAARIDLQTVTLKIKTRTMYRDDEQQIAYREQLMHKREHNEQFSQGTELVDSAKRHLAQSRSDLGDLKARTVF